MDDRETRIQLCGPLVVRLEGVRVERSLPGRQGRLLFAYLALGRRRPATRSELTKALWGGDEPDSADAALSALLSKLRRVAPVEGRGEVRLRLAGDAWIDVEAAREALHRAEGAVARGDWQAAWGPARVVQHVTERDFLPGETADWAAERRSELAAWHERALEAVGHASLRIGGGELATAERAAQRLVALAPLRESGTRLLMEVHVRRGNRAEALLAYDALRRGLRDELGLAPSDATQALHRTLLG
jgi:DNA-binding SARP family transcriptional activator